MFDAAKERAARLLGYRPYARAELIAKLEDVPPEVAAAAVDRLAEVGLQDDGEVARVYARERWRVGKWAPGRIRYALVQKGIDEALADATLAELFGEKKHVIRRTAKAARAYKVFRKNAAHIHAHTMKGEVYRDLDEVLRAYLGDRLHLVPGALSYRDAEPLLLEAGADRPTLEALKELFALCEAYRFTHGYDEPADTKAIVQHANRVVKTVERKLK